MAHYHKFTDLLDEDKWHNNFDRADDLDIVDGVTVIEL